MELRIGKDFVHILTFRRRQEVDPDTGETITVREKHRSAIGRGDFAEGQAGDDAYAAAVRKVVRQCLGNNDDQVVLIAQQTARIAALENTLAIAQQALTQAAAEIAAFTTPPASERVPNA